MKLTKSRLQRIIKEEINNLGEGWWPFGGGDKKKAAPEAEPQEEAAVSKHALRQAWREAEPFLKDEWAERPKDVFYAVLDKMTIGPDGDAESLAELMPKSYEQKDEDGYYSQKKFGDAMKELFASKYRPGEYGVTLDKLEEYGIYHMLWPREARESKEARDSQARVQRKTMSQRFGEKDYEPGPGRKRSGDIAGYGPGTGGGRTRHSWASPFRESKQSKPLKKQKRKIIVKEK